MLIRDIKNNLSAVTMKMLLPNKVRLLSPHIHCSSLTIQVHTSTYTYDSFENEIASQTKISCTS